MSILLAGQDECLAPPPCSPNVQLLTPIWEDLSEQWARAGRYELFIVMRRTVKNNIYISTLDHVIYHSEWILLFIFKLAISRVLGLRFYQDSIFKIEWVLWFSKRWHFPILEQIAQSCDITEQSGEIQLQVQEVCTPRFSWLMTGVSWDRDDIRMLSSSLSQARGNLSILNTSSSSEPMLTIMTQLLKCLLFLSFVH